MARGRADYLLHVDGALVGVIEAKREGVSLIEVEQQSSRYAASLTAGQQLAAWRTPLPFRYESSGVETRFTNDLDPVPRSRRVFSFHRPETIARWIRDATTSPAAPTFRARLRAMPELSTDGLRPNQIEAITGLEWSTHPCPARLTPTTTRHQPVIQICYFFVLHELGAVGEDRAGGLEREHGTCDVPWCLGRRARAGSPTSRGSAVTVRTVPPATAPSAVRTAAVRSASTFRYDASSLTARPISAWEDR